MCGVNAAELRKKDKKELMTLVQDLKKKLSEMRFKLSANKVKNTKEMSNAKKEIARILTVLNEQRQI